MQESAKHQKQIQYILRRRKSPEVEIKMYRGTTCKNLRAHETYIYMYIHIQTYTPTAKAINREAVGGNERF